MNDSISRKAAIEQLHQSYNLLDAERRLEDMPSAQPVARDINVLSNDLVSRQAAIDSLNDEFTIIGKTNAVIVQDYIRRVNNRLRNLPSAQPKAIRPKFVAEDRYIKNHFTTYPHCPKCNYELETGDCYCKVCGCHIDWSEDDVPGNGL